MAAASLGLATGGGDFERSGLWVGRVAKFDGDFGLEVGISELGFIFGGADENDAVALFDPTSIDARRVGFGGDLDQGGSDAAGGVGGDVRNFQDVVLRIV